MTATILDPLRWALARLAPRSGWLLAGFAVAVLVFLLNAGLMAAAGATAGGLLLYWWLRGLALSRVAARYIERLVSHHALFLSLAELRVWIFRRIAARAPLGPGFERASDWFSRLTHDVEALDGLYMRALMPFGLAVVAGLVAALALWPITQLGAVAALLLAAGSIGVALLFAARAAASGTALAAASGQLRAGAVDAISGLRTLVACGALPDAGRRLRADDAALIAAQRRVAMLAGRATAAGVLLAQGALLAAVAFAGLAWHSGEFPPLVAAGLLVLVAALEPIGALPRAGEALAISAAAAARLRDAAERPPAMREPAVPGEAPRDGSLELRGVSFAWGSALASASPLLPSPSPAQRGRAGEGVAPHDESWARGTAPSPALPRCAGEGEASGDEGKAGGLILDGLCLTIPDGAMVAILGESGAGKSSLLAALLKLAPLAAGDVRIGGQAFATLTGEQARAAIAALPQGAHLFAATIRENLALARADADDALMWRALDLAALGDFVRGLPDGLDTWVGEGGAAVSGGQARRLALARVFLQPGRILLLDEPCSGLDGATERQVLAKLEHARRLAGGRPRTVVLLLHRLTGAERLDDAYRLANGRLQPIAVTSGTPSA